MFESNDMLEYSPEFKKELVKANYLANAIDRKFLYEGEKVGLFGKKLCVLYCLDGKIKVSVSPEHLVKVS